MPQSVASNITLPRLRSYRTPFGLLDRRAEDAAAARFRDRLRIRTASLHTPVGNLSGGNQQKTMLAKWLNAAPRVLVLDEPTRGIDVGAKADVHKLIDDLAREGVAVVVISSDLPEVLAMSDRIVVMREGRVRAVFTHDDADPERVMAAAVAA
jgi:rhamnose transport system ATP-binding protein